MSKFWQSLLAEFSSMVNTKISIPGYQVSEQLYNGYRTLVYRGYRQNDQLPVVIKLLKNPYPHFNELVQFRNQYTITKNLNSPLIIQTYSLETYQNSYALVMEDFGGISLHQWVVKKEKKLSLIEFLEVGVTLCNALEILYRQRIIHKDIKPSNILINPQTKEIKLIDFSIASLLPKETQTLINPNILEGTLAYISPEQTGRMNRGIDYRTDFYSLGVTFYELLTGKLPFQSNDPMELVHCHIAKKPQLVNEINSGISSVLSEIVEKLMAKNAEDRYQSTLGLKYDLENCLTQLQQTSQIKNFEIGRRDVSDRFIIPDKLYGRENEIDTLLQAFERVSNPPHTPHPTKGAATSGLPSLKSEASSSFPPFQGGREGDSKGDGRGVKKGDGRGISSGGTEMMLVAGFSGIGKTAVVNEVHKPIVRQRGYFIKGKFDQFQRNVPFSAFVQAFRSLIGQLLGESNVQLSIWGEKILAAVGTNAQVIIEVIPELERIIGQQPPVAELSGTAAQNRFNLLFQKFIAVFTTPEHPLVIFLDDLQWADSASLTLLKLLMAESESGCLLVLGAYRDNEVFPAHPLMLTLEEIKKYQVQINTLTLKPLAEAHIHQLVADTLLCATELAAPLAELVYQKTQGNPFFTTQFLQGLYEENCIIFEAMAGYWQCDLRQVRQLALTDDVVEFMVMRLQKLPVATQEVLKLAACLGNRFDLETLAVVCDCSQDNVAADLWRSLQEGLVIPENETYKFFQGDNHEVATDSNIRVGYRFLHDRVQQAAYALIPQAEKEKTHYQIGKLLSKELSQENIETNIFDIVNQLNFGQALVSKQSELDELAQLNLIAGKKAKNTIAYEAGFDYANKGLSLLGDSSWERQYQLTLKLYNLATELAYLTGDFPTIESLVSTINNNAREILDKVSAVQTQIQFYASQQNYSSAITVGRNILQELGISLLDQLSFEEIKQEYRSFQSYINQFSIQQIVELPLLKDQGKLAVAKILLALGAPAIISDTNLFWFIILKLVKLSLENGNSPYSAYAYVSYGILVNLIEQDIEKYYQFGQLSLNVVDIFPQNPTKSRVLQVVGAYTSYVKSHLRESLPFLSASYICGLESGDFEFGGYSVHVKCQNLFFSGELLTNLQTEIIQGIEALERINHKFAIGLTKFINQIVSKLIGKLEHPNTLQSNSFDLKEITEYLTQAKDSFSLHHCYLYEAILQYIFANNKDRTLFYIQIAEDNLDGAVGWLTEYIFYFYDSLIYLDYIHHTKNLEEKLLAQYLQKVDKNQKKYEVWAAHAPMNFQHKYDLVEAEKNRALGNKFEALELYDKAIVGAKENGFIQEEALANELAAKFYLNWGKEKIAQTYMQEAYYCYARWGAKAKTNDLEKLYPQLLQPILQQQQLQFNPTETIGLGRILSSTYTHGTSSTNISCILDFTSVLKAAQAISSSLELDQLIASLTRIIIENSGAKKAVLMLPQNNIWQVKAMTLISQQEIQTNLTPQLLENSPDIPIKIIHYVQNTQQTVLINNCQTNIPGLIGEYMLQHQPQSVLCTPMIHQENLVGILYLENDLTPGVFTSERLQVINLLCAQAAISLENAQLYAQQQEKNRQIAQKEEEYRSIFESVNDGLDICDLETGKLVAANPTIYQIYGYNQEEWLQATPADFIHPDYIHLFSNFLTTLRTGQEFYTQTIGKRKDGSFFDVEVKAVPFMYKGKLHGLTIVRDITEQQAALREREKAEAAVVKKSLELETALEELKQAQLQMIHSEKMSALGNLVSGIGHEMNNPLGFISASLEQIKPMIADIIEHLQLYQESLTNKSDEIVDHAEEIDLDYSLEDLPKMIDSMTIACDRLKNISTSLRTFSRADKDYQVPFNIHEGIDSTILILKHRLKANQKRPAIEVITNYGNLPKIYCFPGQLNQVFMNIIANAIDALDESNTGLTFAEIKANPNRIIITTSVDNKRVKIAICDNGHGMNEEVKAKIFEHFTTKAVGKGTGLGLAIARQIIERKHGGNLYVASTPGEGTEFTIVLPLQ